MSFYRFFKSLMPSLLLAIFLIACSKGDKSNLPENFKSLSTDDKMAFLMDHMTPDSLARFLCNSAMGKVYNSRIELQPAMAYAYEHYNEDDQVAFALACEEYQQSLPLHEKVKFAKLAATEDPDIMSYELGLAYVGDIRENHKDVAQVTEEIDKLTKECRSDPDFYKRFMKGFKTALRLDRHRDLDDKIYLKFISYPDSIK